VLILSEESAAEHFWMQQGLQFRLSFWRTNRKQFTPIAARQSCDDNITYVKAVTAKQSRKKSQIF